MHNIDLPFHEFGHILFRPFGEWPMFMGGSLFQCALPLILGGVFLWRESNPFPASMCLWWAGENLLDLAPYIGDARAMGLPLVGEWGEEAVELRILRHDWHNILEPMGMLAWDHRLAALAHTAGTLLMALAWIWGRSEKTVPIPGVKTAAQAEENAGAMQHGPLTPEQIAEIDGLLGR